MKRIDFLGAPGVGKTTLCNLILRNHTDLCMSENKALLMASKEYCKTLSKLHFLAINTALRIPNLNTVMLNSILNKVNKECLKSIYIDNKTFLEKVNNTYCSSNNPFGHRKISGLRSFLRKMEYWEFIKQNKIDGKYILSDESISQKIFGIYGVRALDTNDKFHIEEYFKSMPLPFALITVVSDHKNVFENIKKRYKETNIIIPGHKNIDDDTLKKRIECGLYISEKGHEILKERNANVIKVDSRNPMKENIKLIMDFLNKI